MMKKQAILFLGLMMNWAFAQCDIEGNSQISAHDTAVFGIGNELAQCKQCHQWSVEGNATIVGDNRQNKVSVKAQSSGKATLHLQYFSPQGLVKCSKDVAIVGGNAAPKTERKTDADCDIQFDNYKEVKMGANAILFYPDTPQELTYTWEVDYKDGTKKTSSEKVPQFPLYENNPIEQVKVRVFSKSCYKKFAKTYNQSFWELLK